MVDMWVKLNYYWIYKAIIITCEAYNTRIQWWYVNQNGGDQS